MVKFPLGFILFLYLLTAKMQRLVLSIIEGTRRFFLCVLGGLCGENKFCPPISSRHTTRESGPAYMLQMDVCLARQAGLE